MFHSSHFVRYGACLVLMVLFVLGGCQTSQTVQHQIPDTERQLDAQVNRGRIMGENSSDTVTLDLYHVLKAVGYVQNFPNQGLGEKNQEFAFQRGFLAASADRDSELLARIADKGELTRVDPNEIRVLSAHLGLRESLNRLWVVLTTEGADVEHVLLKVPQPAAWPARVPLQQRNLGGSNLELLTNARMYQMQYSALMRHIFMKAQARGDNRLALWNLQAQEADMVVALVVSDIMALRSGVQLVTESRSAATYDMVDATRRVMALRATESYGPMYTACRQLTPAQAQQLIGTSWTDADALARFRGWWTQSAPSLTDKTKGWLFDLAQDPNQMAVIWWTFRCIPSEMFSGPGVSLPPPLARESDSSQLSYMWEMSILRDPVAAPPSPQPEATKSDTTAAK